MGSEEKIRMASFASVSNMDAEEGYLIRSAKTRQLCVVSSTY